MDMTKFAEKLTATVQQKLEEEFFKEATGLISRVGMDMPVTLDLTQGQSFGHGIKIDASHLFDALQEAYVKENLESRLTSAMDAAVQSAPSPAPTPVWMILKGTDLTVPGDEFFDPNKKTWIRTDAIYRIDGRIPHRRNIAGLQNPTCSWSRLLNAGEITTNGDIAYSWILGIWETISAGMKVQSDSIVARIEE